MDHLGHFYLFSSRLNSDDWSLLQNRDDGRFLGLLDFHGDVGLEGRNRGLGNLGQFYSPGFRIDEFFAPVCAGIEPCADRLGCALTPSLKVITVLPFGANSIVWNRQNRRV